MLQAALFVRLLFGFKEFFLNRMIQQCWIITGQGESCLKQERGGFTANDLPTFGGGIHKQGSMAKVVLNRLAERYQNALVKLLHGIVNPAKEGKGV